jgi:2-succinyl-5-enolpyruvyl-6-hydroxy-3-cyclohexene-1-carboxylate synthase
MAVFKQSIVKIPEICARKQLVNIIISPGSRSAPLALAFVRHSNMRCKTIVDERSAAYIALGMAQQTGKPAGLVCTSGTAVLNYAPAVAEAYYQRIPLVIFTADRPPEWIDQNDGQTVHQQRIYGEHCRGFFQLPVDDSNPDAAWHAERIISEAINRSQWPTPGPVQVNVPLREPLYPDSVLPDAGVSKVVSIHAAPATDLQPENWQELTRVWQTSPKRLVVAGMQMPDARLLEQLAVIQQENHAVVLCDITSNLSGAAEIQHHDLILKAADEQLSQLAPDLLITLGGPVVSKSLKQFLRKYKAARHWQLQFYSEHIDTFQSLTDIIAVAPELFFARMIKNNSHATEYASLWRQREAVVQQQVAELFTAAPFFELSAFHKIVQYLPQNSKLQLGNSSLVRWGDTVPCPSVQVNCNRGTSGIDGTLSTAVGAAMVSSELTTVILGDLAFFYDRNALWHPYLPDNLRIIVFNNAGGGIFRILDGSRELPELAEHFETSHQLTAANSADDFDLLYLHCDSLIELEKQLPGFFEPHDRAVILELTFDKRHNAEAFLKFQSTMREIPWQRLI